MPFPPRRRANTTHRSRTGLLGLAFLALMLGACLFTLPYTLGSTEVAVARDDGSTTTVLVPRYVMGDVQNANLPPSASFLLGTDALGRSLLFRSLAGGGISLGIGLAAAAISVLIGTLYGALAGYLGGRVDAILMRVVDVLYGLPYILLVILLAVASDALLTEYTTRQRERGHWVSIEAAKVAEERHLPHDTAEVAILLSQDRALDDSLHEKALALMPPRRLSVPRRMTFDVIILLTAIGGVSWLTMSRVIRGQVLSLKNQPFIEAARALGIPPWRIFLRHLLPNLTGPIIVYATLTVPQAILQESFLSFLGIGVKTPLPSWGNLAAEGLPELNPFESHWWLLLFPCLLLGSTLLALNFVGEALREFLDPRRRAR